MEREVEMDRADWESLLAARLTRELDPAELARARAWIAEHPDDRAAWMEEEALDALLDELPPVEAPSNFMARVWDGIDAAAGEAARTNAPPAWREALWILLPRLGWACAVVVVALALWRREADRQRVETAQGLVPVAEVAQLPSVEVLRDFEAIRSLGEPMVGGDLELLAVLEEAQ
jgi:hypothetical protein